MTAEIKSAPPEISSAAYEGADRIREQFIDAKPFRHVVIEDFFEPQFAERLLEEFPTFDRKLAISESGEVGGKAVNTKIAAIGPAYEELYSLLSSTPFLEYVSRLSGIENLILDPAMYGGGTHENLHGQDLDPHVDFNYDQSNQLHRRLNLIVYLNKGWRPEWGGEIEVHSNPRKPNENQIRGWAPLFNRAIMFETNEYSWHGFPRINLPEDKRSLSRKSLSIYLYTKDRPAEEIAPVHATFYVQRPLPKRFAPGYTLNANDVDELRELLTRRDRWVEMYQRAELDRSRNTTELHAYIDHLEKSARVPLMGYIRQEGQAAGLYPDLWITPRFQVRLTPAAPVSGFTLKGLRPSGAAPGKLSMLINGEQVATGQIADSSFVLNVHLPVAQSAPFELALRLDAPPPEKKPGGDQRDIVFLLTELRAQHPKTALLKRIKD